MDRLVNRNRLISKLANSFKHLKSALTLFTPAVFAVSMAFQSHYAMSQEDFSSTYQAYNNAIASGEQAEALIYAKKALAFGSAEFGADSENTANLNYNLVIAYLDNREGEQAYELLGELKSDYARLFGETSVEHYVDGQAVKTEQLKVRLVFTLG